MNAAQFVSQLLDADQHRGGLKCLRAFEVEPEAFIALQREAQHLCQNRPASCVGRTDHVSHWTAAHGEVLQYSLLNTTGRTDDFSSDHDLSSQRKWFFDAATYPLLDQLIAEWPHLVNFRINVLEPGAGLPAHEEHIAFRTRSGKVGARLRFHLPVSTNDGCELNLDGEVFHLQTGVVHLVNHGCVHAARNKGTSARAHLVWDALLTRDLFTFLFEATHSIAWLRRPSDPAVHVLRYETLCSYRRLPPEVAAMECKQLTLCDPQ